MRLLINHPALPLICHKRHLLLPFFLLCAALFPAMSAPYNYAEVLQKSMWFYEVQRSGKLSPANRVEWRGNSALNDGSDVGHDLSGGWYDAGDNMKFNFPMASSVTLLAWGALEYGAGYRKIGQWGFLLDNIKWVTDYFIKCHTAPEEFYGQIGHGMTDHKWWGAPEVFPNARPAFKIDAAHPGSDLAGEVAAALASSSILFKGTDPAYAALCLKHARELFAFADTRRGLYHEAIPDVVDYYKSWSGYVDELVWAALWLHIATGERAFLDKAETWYADLPKEPQSTTPCFKEALSWDDKTCGCYVLLAKITDKAVYHSDAERLFDWWAYGFSARGAGATWSNDLGVAYTPGGLAWIRQWGPIRYAANTAFAAYAYCDGKSVPAAKATLYKSWAKSQIDYALGDNELKRSYVCGFGNNPPVKPHHRAMHGPYLDDNGRTPVNSRHVLFGALAGGPSQDGSFTDDRLDAVRNEVATDYNAGFSSALARLVEEFGGTPLADFPQAAMRDTEYVVVAKVNTKGDRFTEISATVQNRTTWPARYAEELKLRYYVDLSEVVAANIAPENVVAVYRSCVLCTIPPVVSPLKKAATGEHVYVTEISFDGERIFPGGQSAFRREVQFRIGLPDTFPQNIWDPTNDPSYTSLGTMPDSVGHPYIPVYEKGVLVWGTELDKSTFTPAKWNRPDCKEPAYGFAGWDQSLFKGIIPEKISHRPHHVHLRQSYSINKTGTAIVLTASEPLTVDIFMISGRKLTTKYLVKGEMVSVNTRSLTNVLIIQVAHARGISREKMLY